MKMMCLKQMSANFQFVESPPALQQKHSSSHNFFIRIVFSSYIALLSKLAIVAYSKSSLMAEPIKQLC